MALVGFNATDRRLQYAEFCNVLLEVVINGNAFFPIVDGEILPACQAACAARVSAERQARAILQASDPENRTGMADSFIAWKASQ